MENEVYLLFHDFGTEDGGSGEVLLGLYSNIDRAQHDKQKYIAQYYPEGDLPTLVKIKCVELNSRTDNF
jgi:hypothetical protein